MISKFINWLWGMIKSFSTVKGLISLLISFMVFVGWALVFVGLGFAYHDTKLLTIGSTVICFWALPLTPMWGIIIGVAAFIRSFILKDRHNE